MAKGHGGKRTGAGRKPKKAESAPPPGAKTANFSTRITPETRSAIESEATNAGISVSQMAESLIRRGLDAKREAARNSATQALCYILGEVIETAAPAKLNTEKFKFDWRNDPFLFDAVRLSFDRVMNALRPEGQPVAPAERDPQLAGTTFWGPLDTAAGRAEYVATIVLHNLYAARERPKDMLAGAPADIEKKISDTPYDLHRAWKGLNQGAEK